MKVAILHLSDIHLTGNFDFVVSRKVNVVRAVRSVVSGCDKLIVAISGDIAFSGKKAEYDVAYNFLKELEQSICEDSPKLSKFEYIIVPGNHDCSLEVDDVRDAVIEKVLKSTDSISEKSFSYLVNSQSSYWDFYYRLTRRQGPYISKSIPIRISDEFSIVFNCYNSSLLSKRNEIVGGLAIPTDSFLPRYQGKERHVSISIFHHNTGWLTPATDNKKDFEKHLFETSNIVFCGHEHNKKEMLESSLTSVDELIYLEGNAFQNEKKSEFTVNIIDSDTFQLERHTFIYKDSQDPSLRIYEEKERSTIFIHERTIGISLNKTFEEAILKLSIPITHPQKGLLKLNDCYVFQDLEPVLSSKEDYGQYRDSETLASSDKLDFKISIIEGKPQSGKTSLLRMLLFRFFRKGIYPILINGKDLQVQGISELIQKNYKKQYNYQEYGYDYYAQLDKKQKIALIDNVNRSGLNEDGLMKVYERLLDCFDAVIVTVDERCDFSSILATADNRNDVLRYRLLSFGSVKRNAIIDRWLRLGLDPNKIDLAKLEREIKEVFDNVSMMLGEQFFEPYPFYILSLLHGMNEAMTSFDIHQSYYAYCYKSLLISSLGMLCIGDDKIKELLSFLGFLAYSMFCKHSPTPKLKKEELVAIFLEYKDKYLFSYSTFEACISDLEKSNIVEFHENRYRFSSKYIYYYLSAEKLASLIKEPEGEKKVKDLCASLRHEESANILIFLVHHTKDVKLIEELIFAVMLPFESSDPVTLQPNDPVVQGLYGLVDEIKQKVLIQDVNPTEVRQRDLRKQDEVDRIKGADSQLREEYDAKEEQPTVLSDILTATRSVKILGQIVKNERAGLEKSILTDLLKETYYTSFRMIGFFGCSIKNEVDNIVNHIVQEAFSRGKAIDHVKLREQVSRLLAYLLYKFCLFTFSNLIHSVGRNNLNEIYDQVASDIGTPAAKLVSFSIESYYGPMDISSLEELYKEFSKNPVAQQMLRARALHYVYHNIVPLKEKQRIGQICGVKLVDIADVNKGKR